MRAPRGWAVAVVFPVLALGGCFGSRLRAEGMHGRARTVAVMEGVGLALAIAGPAWVIGEIRDAREEAEAWGEHYCPDVFGNMFWVMLSALPGAGLIAAGEHSERESLGILTPKQERRRAEEERAESRRQALARERTRDPERLARMRKTGALGAVLMATGLGLALAESGDGEEVNTVGGMVLLTGLILAWSYEDYVRNAERGSRRTQLFFSPAGASLVYRF